ncbi:MAG: DUF481 domain-containing protein [Deltaproteobacteria bacterium]|nr:DUF481 domain-containing protein [Deltaproteobacteria bacterium]MBW2121120.1 DUF481 domain-containing protein [Deltaproteobacteria bacterium]
MRRIQALILLLVVAAAAGEGYAGGKDPGAVKKWKDEADLSFVSTSGNTSVTTLAGNNLLSYQFTEKSKGSWKIGALYGEEDGEKTAERYYTDLRFDRVISGRFYAYGLGRWLRDTFAGFQNRYSLGPGVGYRFFVGPKHFLLGEAGLNYTVEDYTDETSEDFVEGRVFGKYEYAFTDRNKFSQSLEFLYDFEESDNYKIVSETAFVSALSNYLSLKVAYKVRYNNRPRPSTLDKTDTILGAALVVTF